MRLPICAAVVLYAALLLGAAPSATFLYKGTDEKTGLTLLEPVYPVTLGAVPENAAARAVTRDEALRCEVERRTQRITFVGEPGVHELRTLVLRCDESVFSVAAVQFER